jgi:hypothetical protein
MKIFKYPLKTTEFQDVSMPRGAEILSAGVQAGVICLWAIVEEKYPPERRRIVIHGTGHDLSSEAALGQFLGTCLLAEGALVFHVFESTIRGG